MIGEKEQVPELEQKQAFWNETMQNLDGTSDGLGLPVDEGIKETVTAFRVNQFPTDGSCEGHVEERFGKRIKLHPYVAVGFEEPSQRFIGDTELRDRIAKKFVISPDEIEGNDKAVREYWDYIQNHDVTETPEFLAVRAKNEELCRSAADILKAFYEQRRTPESLRLSIQGVGPAGHFRVEYEKESPQEVSEVDLEKLRLELAQQQEEMRAFSQYLKDRFFNPQSNQEN